MSNNERKTVDQIRKGDKFESSWSGKVFEIEHVIDGGKFVVYKRPSDADYGVTEGSTFLRPNDYRLKVPFFEIGKVYAYKGYSGAFGSDRYTILSITEYKGKKVATYVESSHGDDQWFGTLSENDYAKYGNEVTA